MERTADDICSLRDLRVEDPARFAEAFRQFEALYSEAFPPGSNLTERPDVFLERLETREPAGGQPWFDIAVCLDPGSRSRVLGGICFEFYRPSCCGFLTYAVVDKNRRQKGIAGRLIRAAMQRLEEQAGGDGPRAIFAEAERPDRLTEHVEVARERVSILGRLGALHVPVPYVQPPLELDGSPAEHLMLLVFPGEAGDRERPPHVERDVLAAFLTDLYRSLGAPDHPGRVESTANVGETITPLRIETGSLRFPDAVVCLHAVVEEPPLPSDSEDCPIVGSMERDLLARNFQDNAGFRTQCFTRDEETEHGFDGRPCEAWISFPERTEYRSEGRVERRSCVSTRRRVQLLLSCTRFPGAGLSIWHLSLRPAAGESFDELDIIKLIHLYDGRAEQTRLREEIRFALKTEREVKGDLTIERLLKAVIEECRGAVENRKVKLDPGWSPAVVAGTVQICRPAGRGFDLASCAAGADLAALVDGEGAESRAIRALCGIVTGVLDFDEIGGAEAADTLAADAPRAGTFLRVHRRTMVQVSHSDRALSAVRSLVGVSPYLVIPHAAIIYNEHLLERSQEMADKVAPEDPHAPRERRRANLEARQDAHAKINDRMKRLWLSNVFHYPTERALFKAGLEGRGAFDRYASLELELANLDTYIEAVYENRRHRAETWIAILLAVISFMQVKDLLAEVDDALPGVPLAGLGLGLAAIVVAGGLIYWLRRDTIRTPGAK